MNRRALVQHIEAKQSFLCVGLDPDWARIPAHLKTLDDPLFEFCKAIIDATQAHCVAYKPNLAFFEAHGAAGWRSLEKVMAYIPDTHFTIADAKRGDIGNTAAQYAKAFFEQLPFDSITLSPYMGRDTVTPFLEYAERWVILLGLTSNASSKDLQLVPSEAPLYARVFEEAATWGTAANTMFVVGATHPDYFTHIRRLVPEHFLLVPGVGAQGGSLEEVFRYGANAEVGLLVNSSRGIIFASEGTDFAEAATAAAAKLHAEMRVLLQGR